MATNTKYDVMNMNSIDKTKVNFNGKKNKVIIPAGSLQNIDISFADDVLITGAILKLENNNPDDSYKFQVVHPNGVTVLNEFIDWYAVELDENLLYPAKIPGGLIVRIAYQSAGTSDVIVRVNYKAHKITVVE
jgi:hypothetical protein